MAKGWWASEMRTWSDDKKRLILLKYGKEGLTENTYKWLSARANPISTKTSTSTIQIVPKDDKKPEGVMDLVEKQKPKLKTTVSTISEIPVVVVLPQKEETLSDRITTYKTNLLTKAKKFSNNLFGTNFALGSWGGGHSFGGGSGAKIENPEDYYFIEDVPSSIGVQDTRTYSQAFADAYKKSEGTVFEWRGKKYKAVKAKTAEEYQKNRERTKVSGTPDGGMTHLTTRYYYDKDGNLIKTKEMAGIYASGKRKISGTLMKLGGKIIEI